MDKKHRKQSPNLGPGLELLLNTSSIADFRLMPNRRAVSPISKEEIAGNEPWPTCGDCASIFVNQNVTETLWNSELGLECSRDLASILQSALNGCNFCRELLCVPHDCTTPDGRGIRRNQDSSYESVWPIQYWSEKLKAICDHDEGNTDLKFHIKLFKQIPEYGIRIQQAGSQLESGEKRFLEFDIGTAFGTQGPQKNEIKIIG